MCFAAIKDCNAEFVITPESLKIGTQVNKFECKKLNKKSSTTDRFLYIKLIEQELKSHIGILYDDNNLKHRSHYALIK